jgi:hypothetical protein
MVCHATAAADRIAAKQVQPRHAVAHEDAVGKHHGVVQRPHDLPMQQRWRHAATETTTATAALPWPTRL